MKILVVCKYKENLRDHAAPFVVEQMHALQSAGVECQLFLVKGKGAFGYLKQLGPMKKAISTFRPDVIHAHFGLSGVLATLQHKVPVVTTFHGSDINNRRTFPLSRMAMRLSAWSIFVSRQTLESAKPKGRFSLIPCGVDFNELQLTGKTEAKQRMNLDQKKRYVLFAGSFDNSVKDPSLAKQVVALFKEDALVLLELKGYTREEVTLLMCAADVMLMTSVSEGSPQVINEAMACGCPIVSVDVGDVRERTHGVEGCYIAQSREPQEIVNLLQIAMDFDGKTKGRDKLLEDGLENGRIADNLIKIYNCIK